MVLLTLVVLALLVGGVVATVLPRVPGGVLLSIIGVYLYWWGSGYSTPSTTVLVVLTLLGLLVLASKIVGPVITAKIGGISPVTTAIGGVVGGLLFIFWGTIGLVAGMFLTVFALEYLRRGDVLESLVASFVVVLATFAQKAVKVLVALVILLVMVVSILI